MARHEGDFRAVAGEPLSLNELLELLNASGAGDLQARQDAIACFLSASEGWRDAAKRLDGAFAERPERPPRGEPLRECKPD